jgi:hypothetical protein
VNQRKNLATGQKNMSLELKKLLLERLSQGLLKSKLTKCSTWAENTRIMGRPYPGPWNFKHHPWLKEMMDAEEDFCVGQKAAQMGYTECVLNRSLYKMDIEGSNVLYVLPTKTPDATDFSSSRFDPALELSDHLSNMFSDVKNVGHKRAGSVSLFIRGSKSRAGLKSIPAGFIVLDELDEMDQDNIPLALERTSGQLVKQVWKISTPTIEDHGINIDFKNSTQEHFMFPCPSCSRFTELIYPECLVIPTDSEDDLRCAHLICKECKNKLNHEEKHIFLSKGKWVPENDQKEARGFYINQMYSSTITPENIAKTVILSRRNAADEQELYNSKLGLAHSVAGSRITEEQLVSCTGEYVNGNKSFSGVIVMGIDVGKWIHYEIGCYNFPERRGAATTDLNAKCTYRMMFEGKALQFEELDSVLDEYKVQTAVCDIQPERRKAYEFSSRNYGRVRLCYYAEGIAGKLIKEDESEQMIAVDRTSWMDAALNRFKVNKITLPINLSNEYKEHLKAPTRIYEKDNKGNPVARYVNGKLNDHFAHARTYNEIALAVAAGQSLPRSIKGI